MDSFRWSVLGGRTSLGFPAHNHNMQRRKEGNADLGRAVKKRETDRTAERRHSFSQQHMLSVERPAFLCPVSQYCENSAANKAHWRSVSNVNIPHRKRQKWKVCCFARELSPMPCGSPVSPLWCGNRRRTRTGASDFARAVHREPRCSVAPVSLLSLTCTANLFIRGDRKQAPDLKDKTTHTQCAAFAASGAEQQLGRWQLPRKS